MSSDLEKPLYPKIDKCIRRFIIASVQKAILNAYRNVQPAVIILQFGAQLPAFSRTRFRIRFISIVHSRGKTVFLH